MPTSALPRYFTVAQSSGNDIKEKKVDEIFKKKRRKNEKRQQTYFKNTKKSVPNFGYGLMTILMKLC